MSESPTEKQIEAAADAIQAFDIGNLSHRDIALGMARAALLAAKEAGGMSEPVFRFRMEYIDYDPDGYYYERWDCAKKVSILAATQKEAFEKLWAMLGDAPRYRSWKARVRSVDEELARDE